MKTIKLIILSLLIFAGERLAAQSVLINNTAINSGTAKYDYAACGTTILPVLSYRTISGGGCPGTLNSVIVEFDDPYCASWLNPKSVTLLTTSLPFVVPYTGCNGFSCTFTLDSSGGTWVVTIDP